MDRTNKNVLGRMFNRQEKTGLGRTRKAPLTLRGFDALEARVVLSGAPTAPAPVPPPTLGGSLAIIGVIPSIPQGPQAQAGTQLAKDVQKLITDSVTVQGKSIVTVAELTALGGDDKALAPAKADGKALMQAQIDLVKAVQAGNPGSAHAEFVAVFGKADAKQVEKAFQDEVKIIIDSHITPQAVAAIAADNAAIQKDLAGTTPPAPPVAPPAPAAGSQLAKDLQKLQNDTLAIQGQSSVTIAELTALQGDEQAIVATGYKVDGKALLKAQTDIAKAVLSGNPAAAKTGFVALFGGKVDINLVNKLFNDEVNIIKDSHITPSALDAIAADNVAVQKDLLASSTPPPAPIPSFGGSLGLLGVIPS